MGTRPVRGLESIEFVYERNIKETEKKKREELNKLKLVSKCYFPHHEKTQKRTLNLSNKTLYNLLC